MTIPKIPHSVLAASLLCIACGLLLLWELASPPQVPHWQSLSAYNGESTPELTGASVKDVPDYRLYNVIYSRPVFYQNRRPIAGLVALPIIVKPALAINFALVGIIDAPGQRLGIVYSAGSNESLVVHVGSHLDGWTITEINPKNMVVGAGQETTSIRLAR